MKRKNWLSYKVLQKYDRHRYDIVIKGETLVSFTFNPTDCHLFDKRNRKVSPELVENHKKRHNVLQHKPTISYKPTISFDFWNTLVNSNPKFGEALRKHILNCAKDQVFALKEPEAFVKNLIEDAKFLNNQSQLVLGHFIDIVSCIESHPWFDFGTMGLRDKVTDLAIKYPPIIDAELVQMIEELSKNYRLVIVSNTGLIPSFALMDACPWLQCFDAYYFSDYGWAPKPYREAFEAVFDPEDDIEKGGAGTMVHFGDSPRYDINPFGRTVYTDATMIVSDIRKGKYRHDYAF